MARLPKGCPFSERCAIVNNQCRDVMPVLEPLGDGSAILRACHKSVGAVQAMHGQGAAA
jgi:oligopeptide transport system ATP-binding protein